MRACMCAGVQVSYVPVPCQLAACSGPRRRPGARRPEETRNGDLRTGVVANAPGALPRSPCVTRESRGGATAVPGPWHLGAA